MTIFRFQVIGSGDELAAEWHSQPLPAGHFIRLFQNCQEVNASASQTTLTYYRAKY